MKKETSRQDAKAAKAAPSSKWTPERRAQMSAYYRRTMKPALKQNENTRTGDQPGT